MGLGSSLYAVIYKEYKFLTRNLAIANRSYSASRCIFAIQTTKLSTVPEVTFKGHWRSSAMSSFITSSRAMVWKSVFVSEMTYNVSSGTLNRMKVGIRVFVLLDGANCVTVRSLLFSEYQRVSNRRTVIQTDRETRRLCLCRTSSSIADRDKRQQELSYRKQIALQLRTLRASIGLNITPWPWNLG